VRGAAVTPVGVRISWTPSGNTLGYWIFRSTTKDAEGERINRDPIIGGAFVDVNVEPGVT
jgi:hypothetical protein